MGGKLCLLVNHLGWIVDWDRDTANVYDGSSFEHLVEGVRDEMVVFADTKQIDFLQTCVCVAVGEWNDRMLIESVLSMLTVDLKKVRHRSWTYFKTRLGFTMALFNVLVQWDGLPAAEDGFVPLSIAKFSF